VGLTIDLFTVYKGNTFTAAGYVCKQLSNCSNHNKKLSYRRETARQLHTSFSAHSLIVHFTEHRICLTTI